MSNYATHYIFGPYRMLHLNKVSNTKKSFQVQTRITRANKSMNCINLTLKMTYDIIIESSKDKISIIFKIYHIESVDFKRNGFKQLVKIGYIRTSLYIVYEMAVNYATHYTCTFFQKKKILY